ncbi:NAD(P)/FAD-dependent oxidoreductase [Azospirillum brasilense]|uniref:NAD(P)/FAD-dependent oxidoreductase n=1 Tax=Azospirillum brasilense TaxID=192 RepID=A0A4D8R4U5_AZOBR|nr:FAD-dependent oxidoreductase [Azospirillum brasilense]QCO15793.1 NAD(P)/FAD-dependent oxidoreductase [Azospirillum brasilense]
MTQQIVIAGSGFAGLWAALSAARAVALAGRDGDVAISVVSPAPQLHIRPRLYEAVLEGMAPDLAALFEAVGVRHIPGVVTTIHADRRAVDATGADGAQFTLPYDRFVLAAGSRLFTPPIPGLAEHAFNVDQLDSARALDAHLKGLAARPETAARNTVVVAGGGFTGIETAAEMPDRLRAILGADAKVRVVVVEQAPAIGPDLGPVPRPVIEQALAECGVEVVAGTAVAAIDADGVTTATGERIAAATVVWTAGARANPLAAQITGEHDRFGRVQADPFLRAVGSDGIFVTGDVARAATDDLGNVAAMSCQHALSLGRVAGHNAAAELVGLPSHPYSQPKYVTCLDLGPWGALFTEGWDRQVRLTREEGKAVKREINTKWIYPPQPDRDAVFAIANPDHVIVP